MKKIDEALDGCVQPLRRDPEIALDVRRELAGHLEERMAEGMSEEEALKHFGDPGEIGSGLLLANFRRLKFRARLHLVLMILTIPAVLAALYFAINFRFWAGIADFDRLIASNSVPTPGPLMSALYRFSASLQPQPGPEDRLIISGDVTRPETAEISAFGNAQLAIRDAYPENKVYYAHAVLYAVAEGKTTEFQIEELEKARNFEPANGLYDFLLAGALLKDAIKVNVPTDKSLPPSIDLLDRPRLDRAMAIFREGVQKPDYRTYIAEMTQERLRRLKLSGDFTSEMLRIRLTANILLPHLSYYRALGRALPFYGETLIAEGKTADGEFFLEAWKPFVHRLATDDITLIGLLVDGAIIDSQKTIPRHPVPEARLREIEQAFAPIANLKASISNRSASQHQRQAGMLAQILLPALGPELPDSAFEPERRLNYVLIHGVILPIFDFFCVVMLTGYAIALLLLFLRGKTGFLLTFSRRDYFRILLWGVILPLTVFFGLMEFTPLGGRALSLSNPVGLVRMLGEAVFFVVVVPMPFLILWYRACRRRGRELGFEKLPRAVAYCNMFAGWAVMLVLFTALIRPGLDFAERYWIRQDRLIFGAETFSRIEDQLIKKVRAELLDAIPK